MPNQFGQAGAQPQAPTKFAPLYTGRWSAGLWTNRSPLRDAATTRLVEKFYGAAGDALIAGNNVEITNRLTLARRPGNSSLDSNSYSSVDRFYEFRMFDATSERINIMVDQASALYSLCAGVKTLLWTKETEAGQSYMQSVGNTLYWADGASNKKWMQTLAKWAADAPWGKPTTPFFLSFFIDPNGNIQQLTGTVLTITQVQVANGVATVTCDRDITEILSQGCIVKFPATMAANFLENQSLPVVLVSGATFTANVTAEDYATTAEASVLAAEVSYSATPQSDPTPPTWSTAVPSVANNYQGGITTDGTVQWTNRGNPVQNWGIATGTKPVTYTVGVSMVSWQASTYYSPVSVYIDSNGNLQQVSTPGVTGDSAPSTWATSVGDATDDGTVVWTMIQTAASLVWASHHTYTPISSFTLTSVAAASEGVTVYSGVITGGADDAFVGKTIVVSKFGNVENNGTFLCTGSTIDSLSLQNGSGVSEDSGGIATTQGQFIVANAGGVPCLFQLAPLAQPWLDGDVSAYSFYGPGTPSYLGPNPDHVGDFTLQYPVSTGAALESATTLTSLSFTGVPLDEGASLSWDTMNSAAEVTGTTSPFSQTKDYLLIVLASINFPSPGLYTFDITHKNGMLFGIGNNASRVSGPTLNHNGQTVTAAEGYPIIGGTNSLPDGSYPITDKFVVSIPTAGVYPVEFNYAYWYHSGQTFKVKCNGHPLAHGTPETGSTAPVWPAWSTNYAPNYPTGSELNGQLTWMNRGPVADYTRVDKTLYTLAGTTIIDDNGNTESPYRTGISGAAAPAYLTGMNQLTLDKPNLIWINEGASTETPNGTVNAFNGGWRYCVALVNTLDNTVSNCTPLSAATGNFIGVKGVSLAPGAGLPDRIDSQADYVAIFRTTDGQAVPFLIPGKYTTYTVPLSKYLTEGYMDSTTDENLNNLISGAIRGENTPPEIGAQNLTFHVNRVWYSVGNVIKWTAGADTPVGNGISGTPPLNFANVSSLVKRIVPTANGAIVFTVSDVYIIQGQGTYSNAILPAVPLMQGVGLLSYNALDVNGSIIGFFTSDNQFCILDPSAGVSYAGFPIGDQLRLNNGTPGQSWNPANVYVTWYVNGDDQGWFLSDGKFGWYRLTSTPAPESGYTWSPFATIVSGCKAVQSVEVAPGQHRLLLGPVEDGPILVRDLSTHQDNGRSYFANAVIGSAVLAQPGQVAVVSFITAESVRTGSPLVIAVLLDDALPYYKGAFDMLKRWEPDPPGLKQSRSFYAQRFYLSESKEEAACRHIQTQVLWIPENAPNELLSMTIFGGYLQEN